jgi:hypothetical protein
MENSPRALPAQPRQSPADLPEIESLQRYEVLSVSDVRVAWAFILGDSFLLRPKSRNRLPDSILSRFL